MRSDAGDAEHLFATPGLDRAPEVLDHGGDLGPIRDAVAPEQIPDPHGRRGPTSTTPRRRPCAPPASRPAGSIDAEQNPQNANSAGLSLPHDGHAVLAASGLIARISRST